MICYTQQQINWRRCMKRKRFSEEQIIKILKEADAIGNIREACRQNNVTEQTDLFQVCHCLHGMYSQRYCPEQANLLP